MRICDNNVNIISTFPAWCIGNVMLIYDNMQIYDNDMQIYNNTMLIYDYLLHYSFTGQVNITVWVVPQNIASHWTI